MNITNNYVTLSLETHLFFARIMKEHALFLKAGFACKDEDWIQRAEYFRQEFETLLCDVVKISDGRINNTILESNELVTEFTLDAENQTECLSGIPINTQITRQEQLLHSDNCMNNTRDTVRMVQQINERSICLLNGLIIFKENIIKEMDNGRLFTFNYPLLVEHILREAKLYHSTISDLMSNPQRSYKSLMGTEDFWNQIMMEHALFIRGLLDPSEEKLVAMAQNFAMDYRKLLNMAQEQHSLVTMNLTEKSLNKTLEYRDFKAAGTKGILGCEIDSIIIPLLADHVLREANHYIRILKCSEMKS